MSGNLLIIGAGGVAHVAAHAAAAHNDELGDICIASRTVSKCEAILDSVRRVGTIADPTRRLHARELDASDVAATTALIRETDSSAVVNLATPYVNLAVLQACLETGAAYLDTAVHEDPSDPCEDPPWYANHEWPLRDSCAERGVTAILGVGFDPGVVNAYCALAARHHLDRIETIDIVDVNAGAHGRYFATNFDAEINLREFTKVWSWIDRAWVEHPTHAVKREPVLPVVGRQPVYLTGHDEVHSLAVNLDADSIRFWMGFGPHYITVFTVLRTLGLLSHEPVEVEGAGPVVPLKLVKALLPDPQELAAGYTGLTCIGCFVRGEHEGRPREVFIHQISDHEAAYAEVESQAISYTAGIPPIAAARLVVRGDWRVGTMVNVEQLDPVPFIDLLDDMGLPTDVLEIEPGSEASFDGSVGELADEIAASAVTVTVSAADPMLGVPRGRVVWGDEVER